MHLYGTSDFNKEENVQKDTVVVGSVECIKELQERFHIIYLGARSERLKEITLSWLEKEGFPIGELYLSEEQNDRLKIVEELSKKYRFVAGIGDRWDDNELHLRIGCKSIILQEYMGNWNTVRQYL